MGDYILARNDEWSRRPVHKLVYDIIAKHKSLYLKDLMNEIRDKKTDINEDEVKTALIKLEIWGYIDVSTDNKGTYITLRG